MIASVEPVAFSWSKPNYDALFQERVERLQRIRESPELVPGLRAYYKDHLVEFINDWGCTYDPRHVEIGLPAWVPFVLFDKQKEYLRWLESRWRHREDGLVEKSRDMGVSWLCIAFACWLWLFNDGVVVGFGSRKEIYVDDLNNPSCLFWKARRFIEFLPEEFRPRGWDDKKHAPFMKLLNPETESVIVGEAGDNIGRGARTSIYFVDESAFVEQQDSVDAALSQTTNCKIDVSTPNGAGNAFYRKRKGGRIAVFVFDWRDDPRKSQAWYDTQVAKLDAMVVAAEIDRNYESSVPNAFMDGELVAAAMRRGPADVKPIGGLRVGLDVARFGNDSTVLTFRRGRCCLKQIAWQKLDLVQSAARAHAEIQSFGEKPEQIAVDTCGIGAGVADTLRAWYPDRVNARGGRKIVVDVNASLRMHDGQHYNLRAFMWAEMRTWVGSASLPNDKDLLADLTAQRYFFKGGELLLESKDDATRRGVKSPDRGDSLALTFAEPTIADVPAPKVIPWTPFDSGTGAL